MTTLVLLWGNHLHNKKWIQELNKELLPFYDTTYIHNYRHWDEKKENMEREYEYQQVSEYLKTISWSIILLCKSLWCMLWLRIMAEQNVYIKQAIFIWFPLAWTHMHTFSIEKYLKEITSPILWVQQTNDPAWWYTTIVDTVGSISPGFTCKEVPGNDHKYQEIKAIKQIILDNNAR